MKNALLIHGWTRESRYYNVDTPTPSNDHWLPWLSRQLIIRDISTVAIEVTTRSMKSGNVNLSAMILMSIPFLLVIVVAAGFWCAG